ncbi:MAG TPA: hypothetical protein VG777_07915 [Thermoanaerobaculia bacterium]|nr:hypothetical protein [Thermoanaerobaculia bacterium]
MSTTPAPGPTGKDTAKELDPKEKEDYLEQVEEYEGPDRREPHGPAREVPKEPGVARS